MKSKILLISLLSVLSSSCVLSSPNNNLNKTILRENSTNQYAEDFHGQTLTIYNCEDYIDEDLISEFEDTYSCKVNYYTYDTNETMYNQFTLQPKGTYDLICTSDYMVQRMVREKLVEPIDVENDCPVYNEYAAKPLRKKLKNMVTDRDNDGIKEASLDDYSCGYMWGTLGIIYDPYCSDTIREDVKSWDVFWNEKYKNQISIKNSMRDTFVVGLMHAYTSSPYTDVEDLAKQARETFLNEMENATSEEEKNIARNKYNQVIQNIFDLVITEEDYSKVLNVVKTELISMKKNIFGLEVDSGKNDIITGKIKMNLAWSGDAVYSIDTALEQKNKVLEYYVPEDGANVWYDSWSIPTGGNKLLACRFIDFLSDPSNASRNMDYIGYTSFVASDDVLDLVIDWHGVGEYYDEGEYFSSYIDEETNEEVEGSIVHYDNKFYQCIKDSSGNLPTNTEYFIEVDADELGLSQEGYDLSYLFSDSITEGRSAIIYPYEDSANRLSAQYPDEDTLARCAIMNDFEKANEDVVIMWGQVKAYTNMIPYYVILIIIFALVIAYVIYKIIKKNMSTRNKRRLEKLSK